MAQQTASKQLFDLLVTKNFDPKTLDAQGKPATDPSEAEVFSFDYRATSGNDYGTVVVMIGDDQNLEVFNGDNVGRGMDTEDKNEWYAFLAQLKNLATRNFLSFGTQNINRLKYSMQGQAAIKEGLFESWHGTKNVSYNDRPDHARLMIKHNRTLGEGDARFRYVESLFIETSDGERFKLPFTKLAGGRAMLEHVKQGGKPYDPRGQHIAGMVEEINVLSRFNRANQGRVFEGDAARMVENATAHHQTLQKSLKSLGTRRGYNSYFENWNPAEITEQDLIVENLRDMFVEQTLDKRIEQALPILARLESQTSGIKEAEIFEQWAETVTEGTWALPDTPGDKEKLIALLSQELPVGPDATNATEQLYDLIGDDELFDRLGDLSLRDPDADARDTVINRLNELSANPDVAEVLQLLNQVLAPKQPETEKVNVKVTDEIDEVYGNQGAECTTGNPPLEENGLTRLKTLSGILAK